MCSALLWRLRKKLAGGAKHGGGVTLLARQRVRRRRQESAGALPGRLRLLPKARRLLRQRGRLSENSGKPGTTSMLVLRWSRWVGAKALSSRPHRTAPRIDREILPGPASVRSDGKGNRRSVAVGSARDPCMDALLTCDARRNRSLR